MAMIGLMGTLFRAMISILIALYIVYPSETMRWLHVHSLDFIGAPTGN